MKVEFRKKARDSNSGSYSSITGSGSGGIPYVFNAAGDYVIDKSLHSEGDVVAYSDGGIDTSESNIYLNDIADVDTSGVQHGQVLVFDASKNRYVFKDMETGGITEVHWSDIIDKPTEYNPKRHTHIFDDITTNIDAGEY